MKTIAIDARQLRTGTGRYIERLLHYLQELDHEHSYLVLLKPKDMKGWQPTSNRFSKVACPYEEFSFGEQVGLLKQLNALRPDLVHFGMTQQPVFYRGVTVTTVHDLTAVRYRNLARRAAAYWFMQRVYTRVIKRVASKSQRIIVPSEFVKNDLATYAGIDPGKITVTYEAADPIMVPAEPVVKLERASFLMYIGRSTPHKNLERLIQAFAVVQKTHHDLRLVLAGKLDDNYRRLQHGVEQQGIQNVMFLGFVAEGELRWLYEHAKAYVFPSLSEGFGLPGLEAMVHGCPLISSNATCLPEVYKQGALYFDPHSVGEMARQINAVLDDARLAKRLAVDAKAVAANYSWMRMAGQTLSVYRSVLLG